MKRQVILFVGLLIVVSIFGTSLVFAEETLTGYYNSLDTDCSTNDDCVIKNVGSCCGYHPLCLNKDAVLDPLTVESICQNFDGDCGSKFLLGKCTCQGEDSDDKKCVGHVTRPVIECGDGNCFENETLEDNPQYCPEDCEIKIPCTEEGKIIEDAGGECCEGLESITSESCLDYDPDSNSSDEDGCVLYKCDIQICSDCGDGVCKGEENPCNCPSDCEKEEEVVQNTTIEEIPPISDESSDNAATSEGNSLLMWIIIILLLILIVAIAAGTIATWRVLKNKTLRKKLKSGK